MIDKLAYLTANYLIKSDKSVEIIAKTLAKRKQGQYKKLTREESLEIISYSLSAIYGDVLKIILVLLIASVMHIIIPTIIIMMVFSTYRLFAGGVHMNTFFRCFILMIVLFITGAFIIQNTYMTYSSTVNNYIIILTFICNLVLVKKYAPQDTENKPITDKQEIVKYKRLSENYVFIVCILMFLFNNSNLIVLSIVYGLMLELFTITPVGVKFFSYVDKVIEKVGGK